MEYLDLLSGDIIISFEHITLLECIGKGTFRIDIQFIIISGIPDIIMNNVGDSTVYVGILQCSLFFLSVFLSFIFCSYHNNYKNRKLLKIILQILTAIPTVLFVFFI